MALSDFFDEEEHETTEETEETEETPKSSKQGFTLNSQDIGRHIASSIAGKFKDIDDDEKMEFIENYGFWAGLLFSILGFDDLESVVGVLKPLSPWVKVIIVVVGLLALLFFMKPKKEVHIEETVPIQVPTQQPVQQTQQVNIPPQPENEHPERVIKDVSLPNYQNVNPTNQLSSDSLLGVNLNPPLEY